jgi:RES domain-containing protein
MFVYRIGRAKYAGDLDGEGARLHGGRWNKKGDACIYTSDSRALALLEYTVNVNIDDIPRALSFTTYEIDEAAIQTLAIADLPGDWRDTPAPSSTQAFGSSLLIKAAKPIIRYPSALLREEFNYILNPKLQSLGHFRFVRAQDYSYDVRIKLK